MRSLKAIISLLPTQAGGRKGFICSGYRPNAIFGFDISNLNNLWKKDRFFIDEPDDDLIRNGDIEINFEKEKIYPGEVSLAEFKITEGRERYVGGQLLRQGIKFLFREGGRVVGVGEIIE